MIDRNEVLKLISNYLIKYTVRTRNNEISCKFAEQDFDGALVLHVRPGLFEYSKLIRDWIHITPTHILVSCFRQALEEVFGPEYSQTVQIRIPK